MVVAEAKRFKGYGEYGEWIGIGEKMSLSSIRERERESTAAVFTLTCACLFFFFFCLIFISKFLDGARDSCIPILLFLSSVQIVVFVHEMKFSFSKIFTAFMLDCAGLWEIFFFSFLFLPIRFEKYLALPRVYKIWRQWEQTVFVLTLKNLTKWVLIYLRRWLSVTFVDSKFKFSNIIG